MAGTFDASDLDDVLSTMVDKKIDFEPEHIDLLAAILGTGKVHFGNLTPGTFAKAMHLLLNAFTGDEDQLTEHRLEFLVMLANQAYACEFDKTWERVEEEPGT
jgi:hypothetical protein